MLCILMWRMPYFRLREIEASPRGHKCPPYEKRPTHTSPTPQLFNKYLVRAATSEAMDGAAPDLGRDRPVEGIAA